MLHCVFSGFNPSIQRLLVFSDTRCESVVCRDARTHRNANHDGHLSFCTSEGLLQSSGSEDAQISADDPL